MSYEQIQDTLTFLIEAISLGGFCFLWILYEVSTILKEIDSWGNTTPETPLFNQELLNEEDENDDTKALPSLEDPWGLEITSSSRIWGIPKRSGQQSIKLLPPSTEDKISNAPLNNQLAIATIGWQAIAQASILLDNIKASELKSIASDLKVKGYRKLKKTELMLEIFQAFENAPAFSE